MSNQKEWRCKSCHTALGEVIDGSLVLRVRAESIDRTGVARVPCPTCERVKTWFPDRRSVTA